MHLILNQFFSTLTLDYGCRPMNDIDKIQGFRHIFSLLFLRPFTHIKKTQSFVLVSKREREPKRIYRTFFFFLYFLTGWKSRLEWLLKPFSEPGGLSLMKEKKENETVFLIPPLLLLSITVMMSKMSPSTWKTGLW